MSVIKDDFWLPEDADAEQERRSSRPTLRKRRLSYGVARISELFFQSAVRRGLGALSWLQPKSLKSRFLIIPLTGPLAAYAALIAFGDLQAPQWTLGTFAASTLFVVVTTGYLVRQMLRPLSDIAAAANRLGIHGKVERLPEDGPCEALMAAKAFNSMSERVSSQVEERIRLLTAFSHDMQTPITRMRLRVELADQFPEQEKLLRDLREAERLVRDGIAYARNSHLSHEKDMPTDLRSFIESVVFDYQDTGRDVTIDGKINGVRTVKPAALRRILSNFIDNALKFAGAAEIRVSKSVNGQTVIAVMDRGPGIAPELIESVKQPFVKLRQCLGDNTPGVGLGLAIAQQLASEMNATLMLENRPGGGLAAQIVFKAD
ncbi:ATP-binding protein [Rhizobium sp. S163]|uniref:ATP-binding protein n=1 Tax=Rhizobium sp. S163 TaxID=3055039 RepID=UPI0025A9B4FF|nr:ATP-binding protein [Rhizobium sp. S163]MDM9648678.1 ATP-binding protein [Rhizobium sp. S163]